jgi:uncharacterized protein YjbJ (UPF0337 family)
MSTSSGEHDPAAIQANIEQTRAEMSETIDAIQEKLSPTNIKEQVKEQVQETFVEAKDSVREATIGAAKGAGSTMWETIKQNPLPAAIAGLSVGWLVRKGSSSSSSTRQRPHSYQVYRSDHQSQPASGQVQQRAGQLADQAQETAGQLANQARNQAEHYAGQAQEQASQATDWLQQKLQQNPLAVGAVAVALGTAVGLSLPETHMEDQLMGDMRDSLMHKAQETAKETMHKAQNVAEEAQSTVKQEAQKQGLTSG